MNAKNFENFLRKLYGDFGYMLTIEPRPVYKGVKYYIKVDEVEIGTCTEYDEEIGGSQSYEGMIAGHGYICLIYSSEFFLTNNRYKKRIDYNLDFPFP